MDIEKEILQKLMYNSDLSYNELWNKKVPSSKFNYYVKQLISKDLIHKTDDKKYTLTNNGMQYVAELNKNKLEKQTIPITCSFVLCVNENNEILLQRRKKQPYLGVLNIPGGKVEFGESTYEAGIRELFEESKLNVKSMDLKLIDEVRTYNENNELFAHIIAHTYLCKDFEGILEKENNEGEMMWINFNEINKDEKIFPNLFKIIPKILETEKIIIQETKRFKDENDNFIGFEIIEK